MSRQAQRRTTRSGARKRKTKLYDPNIDMLWLLLQSSQPSDLCCTLVKKGELLIADSALVTLRRTSSRKRDGRATRRGRAVRVREAMGPTGWKAVPLLHDVFADHSRTRLHRDRGVAQACGIHRPGQIEGSLQRTW